MSALNAKDWESLAQMLDKNANFTRPQGQTTGFSLQGSDDATGAQREGAASVGAVPLPSTVVDQQLHLPLPTHSKKAQQQRAEAERVVRPQGNEIWTQQELGALYSASLKAGGSGASAIATAAARANAVGGAGAAPAGAKGAKPQPTPGAEEPVYTVLYQQRVRAEDVYLGVDFTRDESSAASDGVVVKVEMPKMVSASGLALQVEPFQLTLTSPEYFLIAPLPRRVVAGTADAKWDSASKMLTIQLTGDNTGDEVKIL